MLTLTQKRIKTLIIGFATTSVMSMLLGLAIPHATAYAADYPAGWCSFKQSSDKKTLTASCTDERDNGGFDDVVFKLSAKDTFTFTDQFWVTEGGGIPTSSHTKPEQAPPIVQKYVEKKCETATIKITDGSASITGQYASVSNVSGSFSTWTCTDLKEGKVTIDNGS